MAMAVTCFENIVRTLNLSSPSIEELIDIFWQFVETNDLSEWEEEVLDKTGHVCDYIERSTPLPSDSEFRRLPGFLLQMISDIVNLGRGDLYGAVVGYSQETYELILKVLNLTLEHGFPLPPIEAFQRSRITEYHGWGNRVPRAFFKQSG